MTTTLLLQIWFFIRQIDLLIDILSNAWSNIFLSKYTSNIQKESLIVIDRGAENVFKDLDLEIKEDQGTRKENFRNSKRKADTG